MAPAAPPPLPTVPAAQPLTIKCRTCGVGRLQLKETHRLSGPAVVVGYIFMFPAVLGVVLGLSLLLSVGDSTGAGGEMGPALAVGLLLFLIVGSFVGGLVGYLLTMKKKILQCTTCEAVVQAS